MRSVRLFATATVAMFILIRFLNLAIGRGLNLRGGAS